ncbi:MAG: glycosyltransferase [Saprospiraceae bacterium]|nr:glycosyltransferase [Saprospiraceae bacterium]
MPKIILIGPAHPLRGGLATFDERLAREFQSMGWSVEIYTFSLQYPDFLFPGKTQYANTAKPLDLKIHVVINSMNPLNWIRIGHRIKKENAEIVLTRYWIPFMAPCLGTILRIIRKNNLSKIICITDNIIPHEKRIGDRWLTQYFLKVSDWFICMSDTVDKELKSFKPRAKSVLIDHPLYDVFGPPVSKQIAREHLGIQKDEKVLLFFGFIRKYKGLDLLLESFAKHLKGLDNYSLVIAGEFYDARESYDEFINKYGMKEKVRIFSDFIPEDQVKYFFCACDLVVQPYRTASQSGVTPLAYYFEKPMIVTRVGALANLVPDGKAGFVCEPNPDSIAEAIQKFFSSDAGKFRDFLNKEKKKLSWANFAEEIVGLSKLSKQT